MSTYTFEQLGPVLVSDLPPVAVRPSLRSRVGTVIGRRMEEYRFERALRTATPGEHSDLIAASRRG